MPPPLFHTVMVLFAGSMFTFIVSIVYERIRAPRDKRENHSVQHCAQLEPD